MSTLLAVELGVLGPLQVRQHGVAVAIPGAKPRAILTMLGLLGGSVVSADTLIALLWSDDPPRTAEKALQTHISSLRRALGDGFVLTEGTGWTLSTAEIDASRYKLAARMGRDAAAAGDTSQAVARFDEALTLWRGTPELPEGQRGASEKTRWLEGHAALVEDRADALLATGRAAEIIGELEAAVADAPLRERRWGQLMLALYRAGRQGEALSAYQRARSVLVEELGVDPGPDLRRLNAAIVAQDASLDVALSQHLSTVTRAVTFLLTDIEGSTAAWEADADAMSVALARHDELVEQVVTSRGGRLVKTRGEGDATFSVFDRPSAAAAAAIELQEAIGHEPWVLADPMRIRVALHTGEVELRDGDYFGRAVNRAARLRSLAAGGQILCSGATAELAIDSLPDDVVLADLGMRQLRNLARPEHVFELRLETVEEAAQAVTADAPMERPALPAVLAGPGPFVGRGRELERLLSAWQTALVGGTHAALIAGEPGVGKTRLAGEWSRHAYEQGAVVLYGRCDEDLGAPYQPFAEALRSLMPALGTSRLRGLRGVEALLPLVPGLTDVVPDLATPPRADPDTERYALFDAVVALLGVASTHAPVVLILDDIHWAAKPTLLLLRHLLRFGEHARVQIIGTYRSTDLDRSHPLAAMLADLHRDGSANRIQLGGLDENDVTAYVAEAGYNDGELARALASVTGGNPFFLIEALRHVDESGGVWDPSTLPQGVREAVTRRLSRLPTETNKALATAAVVGSRFALDLVERVVGNDLIDAFDEASQAGIVIEEPGGYYRFNHAIVRQSLIAELASVRRMRLHQRIATTLETEPGADDELLAELAYHYFECAWAGNAAKAVDYCRRAADQAMARLAYEGAADLYDRALHALEELDDELPDRDDQQTELLVARCEALLAAGDVVSAAGAVSQLQEATRDSSRLAAWATCFDGQLSMLTNPERLDEIESAVDAAADKLAELEDAAGEAKAHTVRAACLARLGRIGDCETALDHALTAARRARDHRRVNAVLAGAPLAALWGPSPVPRAGGRCLDVVRLLRITTGSPVVEAISTRCQAVLDAYRGRAASGRGLIDSARRTLTELGMRHALLEVDQFAGILELAADDPASAEPLLRRACNGFRRMGLDADTADTAALLARACLALDRDAEADELCTESERLAGHALTASIAWRTVRAQLLSHRGDHGEARRVAEEAIAIAERTDALVDHGDACLALATVLNTAGDAAGARTAAELAVNLYERKGAAALADKARSILGAEQPAASAPHEMRMAEPDNACVRVIRQVDDALYCKGWNEVEQLVSTAVSVESRRTIVGFPRAILTRSEWLSQGMHYHELGPVRHRQVVVAVRGERLALVRLVVGTTDESPGAPQDEMLLLYGLDEDVRISMQMWFDIEDLDAAIAELDAAHARLEEQRPRARRLENVASRVYSRLQALFDERDWDAMTETMAAEIHRQDRRRVVNAEATRGREATIAEARAVADLGARNAALTVVAIRGERLALFRSRVSGHDQRPEAFNTESLCVVEIDRDEVVAEHIMFDPDDIEAAIAELDARYLAGEAAAHVHTWSVIVAGHAAVNRRELPPTTPDLVSIDHRRAAAFAPGEGIAYIRAGWDLDQSITTYIEEVHRLNDFGAVYTHAGHGVSNQGFDAEWRGVDLLTVEGDMVNRCEVFDEADIDAALARFEQLTAPAPRLENAASDAHDRVNACFAARDWDGVGENVADDIVTDDRRRVVNAGRLEGRKAAIAELKAIAEVGVKNLAASAIATRGRHLVLSRIRAAVNDQGPDAFHTDALDVVETRADGRVVTRVVFDPDDLDAAFEELDARYLAGEASAHSHTWSLIVGAFAAVNRHELPELTPDWVNIDHRRAIAVTRGDMTAYINATLDDAADLRVYIEAVHRVTDLGVVVTQASRGTSHQGFDAEWRMVSLSTVDGDRINRGEIFDEADLDAALARFDELCPTAQRLENAASQADDRFFAYFAARDWDAMAEILADDFSIDDRRRVVNIGIRNGRDVEIANMRAAAEIGSEAMTSVIIATRGKRLALSRIRAWGRDQRPEAFHTDALGIVEINADNRIAARVAFDVDDIDAAITELDARYLVGEAAAHAHTWSVIAESFAAVNRHELPKLTPDWVNIDHRRAVAFAPGEMTTYIHATLDDTPDFRVYTEAVHRLSDLGAVITWVSNGTSQEGFQAGWREINISTVEGDLINRSEMFGETDLDAALAKFDELSSPAPRLENAASQADDRFWTYFATRDWDAMAEMVAQDMITDDRRRVVGAGLRHGRDAEIENYRAAADVGVMNMTSDVIATRGGRLFLSRARISGRDRRPEAFHTDVLGIVEINADNRIVARVVFDLDDIDAAFEELDARYVAGEAAAHANTWSVIARAHAAFNRRELHGMTPYLIDHRPIVTVEAGDPTTNIRGMWDFTPDLRIHIETVHRLSDLGAVFTQAAHGTSQAGFDAEWRTVELVTVDGDLINRGELFEDTDIDAAIAQFDRLSRPAHRLENMASRLVEGLLAHFAARDWDAMAESLAADYSSDDRRLVVGAGVRHGPDAAIENYRAVADIGLTNISSTVVATRGQRLAVTRAHLTGGDPQPEAFRMEVLAVAEIDTDHRIVAVVVFDVNELDAAFEELDARYLAGEAAAHANIWSVIARTFAALNRHDLDALPATTPDYRVVDRRLLSTVNAADLTALFRATWDLTPELHMYIEAVHLLNDFGVVITQAAHGTSHEGFDAQWRMIQLLTVEGDLGNHCELFDEADLDAALARFDELSPPTPQLENAASQVYDRFWTYFAARDWAAAAELMADEVSSDDRRRVVGAGIRHGRDAAIADARAAADVGFKNVTTTVIAIRGERLALVRVHSKGGDPDTFHVDALQLVELGADERIATVVVFEIDDIDAAFAELDARYVAGEASAHTWSVIAGAYATLNRHELPAKTTDWVIIDHRRGKGFASDDHAAIVSASWELTPDFNVRIDDVLRLSDVGAVISHTGFGTSQEGFEAEWRELVIVTVEGDLANRCELFDEADIDAALARFDELNRPASRLENEASKLAERFWSRYEARDWDALRETLADDVAINDRRPLVNFGLRQGPDSVIEIMRAAPDMGVPHITQTVIAIRGERLVLVHTRFSARDRRSDAFYTDVLYIFEINADNHFAAFFLFDVDDIDVAFGELDARYLAGEAADHSHTWSLISRTSAAFNRHVMPPTTRDWVNIDHRKLTAFAPGDMTPYMRATFDVAPDIKFYIEAVHRLTNLGAVFTQPGRGISHEGFEAEWRDIILMSIEGDQFNRCEVFDEADMEAALARFDELSPPTPRLENAASQVDERFGACFAARDWDAMAEMLADDTSTDDRRRTVNSGIRYGRDPVIASMRAIADVGVTNGTSATIATRGGRLALSHIRMSSRDQGPEAFHIEMLGIVGINADGRIVARVTFDVDDLDAALEELDARYLAGEASAHAHTWSVIATGYAALNRHEVPPTTPDWVNIDHRRGIAFAPGDMISYIRATWDVAPDVNIHIEAVHRLSNCGAVVTHAASGSSQAGFDAEWQEIALLMVEGDAVNHCEMFDEADTDAALARFEELCSTAPQLENAASQVDERFRACFAARDWDAMAERLADDTSTDDRRPLLGVGARRSSDAVIADWRATAEVGVKNITSTVIAIRGDRLVLSRYRFSGRDQRPDAFRTDVLGLVEIDTEQRITVCVMLDLDDVDAAFEELDARYLAGEAAAHAQTWTAITGVYTAFNRHELPPTIKDWLNVDHRPVVTIDRTDLAATLRAAWDLVPDLRMSVEAVHRLGNYGAVITNMSRGTSRDGFDAEWRMIQLLTVEGELISRFELFDEADIDAALARFEALGRQAPQLENAATRTWRQIVDACNRRDADGFLALSSADGELEDRRKGLRASHEGSERRRAAQAMCRAPKSWHLEVEPIAIRGYRLGLTRERWRDTDEADRPITVESLTLTEVTGDELAHHTEVFDPDDIDAAFEELDARYLAGEAAAHAHTWSFIAGVYAGLNRREFPATTPDWVNIDHRRGRAFTSGDTDAYIRAAWDLTPDICYRIEAVHRLNNLGAVVTHVSKGTSQEGFDAEWRVFNLVTFEDNQINRCELFDEHDLDAALARFEEITRPA